MSHQIEFQEKYIIVTDGLGFFDGPIYNSSSQVTTTGQPIIMYSDTSTDVLDMFYSEYDEVVNGDGETEIVGTQREIAWDIGYSEAEANNLCSLIESISSDLSITPIQHSGTLEWAFPFLEYIFSSLPTGAEKTELDQSAQDSVTAGNRKSIAEMIEAGW